MHAAGDAAPPEPEQRRRLSRFEGMRRFGRRARAWRWPTWAEATAWLARQLATEEKARSGFFLIPVGLMIGIAITDGAGLRMGLGPALAIALPTLMLGYWLGGRGLFGASVLVFAFIATGMALALAEINWTKTTIFSGEATVRIDGRVTWRDRDDRDRMRYIVRIEKTERPTLSRPPEVASILVSSRHEPIPVGGRFQGLVRLRAPSGPAYPGAYDFAFAPFFDGRGANGFSLGAPEPPGVLPVTPTWGERLVRLRLAMSDRIRDVIGGGAGAVASALITGERSGIPDDINDWLRATGLSHVLSISGLHMALVAGFAMVLVRGVLAAIPGAALVLPTKKIAAVAALIVATGYLVISGSDVATDRSYVMLSIMLVAILVDRPALTLRNVAIAAMAVMLTSPHAVVTASFQMSFSATAALVGVYGAISRHNARNANGHATRHRALAILLFLGGLAASSFIAGTATAPYAAYHFQRIAPYGVIANLVAVPIFSFWIMPLALIAALAMPFGADGPFLILIGWALELVFGMAEILATHLPDAPSGRLTASGLLVITAALLFACLAASRLRWCAAPLAILGLVLLPDRSAPPELLIFEDGRELALIDARGHLQPLRPRPNDFVLDQWTRAFATAGAAPSPNQNPTDQRRMKSPNPDVESERQPHEAHPSLAETIATSALRTANSQGPAVKPTSVKPLVRFDCQNSPLPPTDNSDPSHDDRLKTGLAGGSSRNSESQLSSEPAGLDVMVEPKSKDVPRSDPIVLKPDSFGELEKTAPEFTENSGKTQPTPMRTPITQMQKQVRKPPPPRLICRATTRTGIRIAWTDDYRLVGDVCDTADIAIVARAVALRTCRSGARLVTLRTLRETGSLAILRSAEGAIQVDVSITDPEAPWNVHRKAPWPESWRNPEREPIPQQRKSFEVNTPKL